MLMLFEKIFCSSNISETDDICEVLDVYSSSVGNPAPFIDVALSFSRFAFKLSNIPTVECFSKLKALHFVGRSRFIRVLRCSSRLLCI